MKEAILLIFLSAFYIDESTVFCQTLDNDMASIKIGKPVVIGHKVEVNSALGLRGHQVVGREVEDPYGTLKDCTLFTAADLNDNPHVFFVGVYKDRAIIWVSRPFEAESDIGNIYGTTDMNLDGNVEILSSWGGSGKDDWGCLVIHSWDGLKGWRIDQTDEQGYPRIKAFQTVFDCDDLDGDGIYEIRAGDDEMIQYCSWNGLAYSDWTQSAKVEYGKFLPAMNATAIVHTNVLITHDLQKYTYVVHSSKASKRRIQLVGFEHNGTDSVQGPAGWSFGRAHPQNPILFECDDMKSGKDLIRPNQEKTFVVYSNSTPSIGRYYIQSERWDMGGGVDEPMDTYWEKFVEDVRTNSNQGTTIIPFELGFDSFPASMIDTLLSYVDQAHELGWINNTRDDDAEEDERAEDGVVKNLDKRLELTRDLLERQKITQAKNHLQRFLGKVEKLWKRQQKEEEKNRKNPRIIFTSEAYALLKYNGEYLLDHLKETKEEKEDKGKAEKK